jgi:competence protein ComEC
MRVNVLLFVAGAWLLQQQAELPSWMAALPLLAVAAGVLAARHRRTPHAKIAARVLAGILCCGLGFLWAALLAQQRLADALPADLEGRDVVVTGVIAGLPHTGEHSVRFRFNVESAANGASIPRVLALSWWAARASEHDHAALPVVHAGERWRLKVRLRRPHGFANPHGFDYEAWLLERGIRATGYVRDDPHNHRLAAFVPRLQYRIARVREAIRARIARALPDAPYAGVLEALAIGDQRAIPQAQWQTFIRTGIGHLVSISGLHITMVSALVFALVYGLWRRLSRLALRIPARKVAALAGFAAALAYALLAGFGVPAQRTVYMLGAVAIALWLGRTSMPSAVLACALLVVVILDPWAVMAAGFWLSFGAVALILYVSTARTGRVHWLVEWGRVQWAITLGLTPFLLALFQQVSVVSPLANAFAIPVVSLIVVPLTLIGVALPVDWGLLLAHRVMAWCMVVVQWLSTLPYAVWYQHAPSPWTVAVAVIAIMWLLAPRGFPARWLGLVGLLPLFLVLPPPVAEGSVRLTVLDVGQGLAVVAHTRHHVLLYDTGPAFASGSDAGNRVIVPFLRAAGVRSLDVMVVSHNDIDHSGGAASVLQALPVGRFIASLPRDNPLMAQGPDAGPCVSGQHWSWDDVHFEFLYPAAGAADDPSLSDNDRGCVLKIATVHAAALLPADITHQVEARLVAKMPDALRANVIVAPHHGSKTSSSPAFIAAVDPQWVVFSAGYHNRFHHPARAVVARYRKAGVRTTRTDRDGAVTIVLDAAGDVAVSRYRRTHPHYWQMAMDDGAAPAQAAR